MQDRLDRSGELFAEPAAVAGGDRVLPVAQSAGQFVVARFAGEGGDLEGVGTGIGSQTGWHDMEICKKEPASRSWCCTAAG